MSGHGKGAEWLLNGPQTELFGFDFGFAAICGAAPLAG
jgi:hypothetical protein